MKKVLLVFLTFLFFPHLSMGDNISNWYEHPLHPFFLVSKDSMLVSTPFPYLYNGKEVTSSGFAFLRTRGMQKGILSTSFPVFQLRKEKNNITTHIKYKIKDSKTLFLVFTSIGSGEKIINSDTIKLPLNSNWKELEKTVHIADNTVFLQINIEVEGDSDEKPGLAYIDSLEFLSEGKPLNREVKEYQIPQIDSLNLIPWNRMSHTPLLDKRILALGETVHGTSTLGEMAFKVMKERILNHQCKLIMMELPLEFSLSINRYIKGDNNFQLSDILSQFQGTFYPDSVITFIEWLRKYNAENKNEVSVVGADIETHRLMSQVYLFNFLHDLNKNHIKGIDSICQVIMKPSPVVEDILLLLDNHPEIGVELTQEEILLLRYCIEELKEKSINVRHVSRDVKMAEIAKLAFRLYLPPVTTATLYGHFGHLNYLSYFYNNSILRDCKSFGNILKKDYKEDYSCIALVTKGGKTLIMEEKKDICTIQSIPDAPKESLEYQMSQWGKDSVYLSVNQFLDTDVIKLRCVGNRFQEKQFCYLSPKSRMDGVILVEKALPIIKSENSIRGIEFVISAYQEALIKFKKGI